MTNGNVAAAEESRPDAEKQWRPGLIRRIVDSLFGYDFFISYTWSDGRDYAKALVRQLEANGFECFLDSDDYCKGDDWKRIGHWTLLRTSRMVLIGSPKVHGSIPVLRELKLFSRLKRQIIPISFEGTLEPNQHASPLFEFLDSDKLRIDESLEQLPIGPSDAVVNDLRNTFDLMRQSQKRVRFLAGAAIAFALVAVLAAFFWRSSESNLALAETQRAAAQQRLADSFWYSAAKSQEQGNHWEALHFMGRAAAIETRPDRIQKIQFAALEGLKTPTLEFTSQPFVALALLGYDESSAAPPQARIVSDNLLVEWMPTDNSMQGNGIIRGWNLADASVAFPPLRNDFPIYGLQFNAAKNRLLVWGQTLSVEGDNWREISKIRLWDMRTGKQSIEPLEHPGIVGAGFSIDDRQILTWGEDGFVRIWDAETGKQASNCSHEARIIYARFTESKEEVLSIDSRGNVDIWEIGTARSKPETMPTKDRLEEVEMLADSEEGPDEAELMKQAEEERKRVAEKSKQEVEKLKRLENLGFKLVKFARREAELIDSTDGSVRSIRLDLPPGQLLEQMTGVEQSDQPDSGEITTITLNRQQTRILVEQSGKLVLLDAKTGEQLGDDIEHSGLSKAEFSPSGNLFITHADDDLKLWNSSDGLHLTTIYIVNVSGFVFSEDTAEIATWDSEHRVSVFDARSGQPLLWPMPHESDVISVIFVDRGERLLVCDKRGTSRLWNIETAKRCSKAVLRGNHMVGAVERLQGETMLRWEDGTFKLWNPSEGASFTKGVGLKSPISDELRAQGTSQLVTWDRYGSASLWTISGDGDITPVEGAFPSRAGTVFSRDGSKTLRRDEDTVHLRSVSDREPLATPMKHEGKVLGARFDRDEKRILTWAARDRDRKGAARLWNAADGSPITPFLKHEEPVVGAIFDSTQDRILTWSAFSSSWGREDGSARVWAAADGEPITPILKHEAGIRRAMFLHNDKSVLTWGDDNTVRLWDFQTGRPSQATIGHTRKIHGFKLSSDESRILTYSQDGSARLWDAYDGTEVAIPLESGAGIIEAQFDNDESRIITLDAYGAVRFWDAQDATPLGRLPWRRFDSRQSRTLSYLTSPGFLLFADEQRLLVWGVSDEAGEPTAILYQFGKEEVVPPSALQRWVELRTGSVMDEYGNVRYLHHSDWVNHRKPNHLSPR